MKKFPFQREKNEPALAWLMCQQYCQQVGDRSMALVFEVNEYDIDDGLKLAKKYNWEDRANKYDNYLALLDHNGKVSCHAILRQNTINLAKTSNMGINRLYGWMQQNGSALDNNLNAQMDATKMLSALSRVNSETIDAYIKQENIDLVLRQLAKELE